MQSLSPVSGTRLRFSISTNIQLPRTYMPSVPIKTPLIACTLLAISQEQYQAWFSATHIEPSGHPFNSSWGIPHSPMPDHCSSLSTRNSSHSVRGLLGLLGVSECQDHVHVHHRPAYFATRCRWAINLPTVPSQICPSFFPHHHKQSELLLHYYYCSTILLLYTKTKPTLHNVPNREHSRSHHQGYACPLSSSPLPFPLSLNTLNAKSLTFHLMQHPPAPAV